MLYTHEISDPETFVRREARAMLSSCESIRVLPRRLALSQEQKRKIQTLEINVPPHSRREKPAPDGLPIKFRSVNTKNQSDIVLIRNDPMKMIIPVYTVLATTKPINIINRKNRKILTHALAV